ncbi:MAG: SIS domain-containing protein [Chloroflexota bacterium]|nr:SIS domain-containing protein [Chloroflexota bacterium]
MISFEGYSQLLFEALEGIAEAQVEGATAVLDRVYRQDGTIYVVGNGQSATTASAFALDLTKQTAPPPGKRRFRVVSLTDNAAALTAWANDVSYEAIFAEQLKGLWRPDDVLLAISASGNSPNVVQACEWVREQGDVVVGLTGFTGGRVRELADACIHVDVDDYGLVETAHIAIMHYWVDLFRERLAE